MIEEDIYYQCCCGYTTIKYNDWVNHAYNCLKYIEQTKGQFTRIK